MNFFGTKQAPGLTEELIERIWDLSGRIKQLEDRFDGSLDELSKRYRRAEQSEARLGRKTPDKVDAASANGNGASSVVGKALEQARARRSMAPTPITEDCVDC